MKAQTKTLQALQNLKFGLGKTMLESPELGFDEIPSEGASEGSQ